MLRLFIYLAYMADFNKAIAFTLKWEGGYVNDPVDVAGATYRGLTRRDNPKWSGWAAIGQLQPRTGTIYQSLEDSVKEQYRTKYWGRIEEICNDTVAAFVFDYKVNSGSKAIKTLQRIVGTDDDGILGSDTINKTNNYNGNLIAALLQSRRQFYYDIVHNNPSQKKFLNGWLNRIDNFKATFHI
jgi:lysozyme family protein